MVQTEVTEYNIDNLANHAMSTFFCLLCVSVLLVVVVHLVSLRGTKTLRSDHEISRLKSEIAQRISEGKHKRFQRGFVFCDEIDY